MIEQLLNAWDALTATTLRFSTYNVTPRQGRYTVRRKLLRQLQRRLTAMNSN
jgi:hypothetical protein